MKEVCFGVGFGLFVFGIIPHGIGGEFGLMGFFAMVFSAVDLLEVKS